uniref:F-box domain-containing protein n=1 Tax=Acrobeloides nanus TaxID=290746 RepID=A0A914D5Y4_9BILA
MTNSSKEFLDLLPFLERNEVEKCQLVCKNWRQFVENGVLLPLTRIHEVRINDDGSIDAFRYYGSEVTHLKRRAVFVTKSNSFIGKIKKVIFHIKNQPDEKVASFKNCIISRLIAESPLDVRFTKAIKQFLKEDGYPLHVEECNLWIPHSLRRWYGARSSNICSIPTCLPAVLQKLFSIYAKIEVLKLCIIGYDSITHVMQDPDLINKMDDKIKLKLQFHEPLIGPFVSEGEEKMERKKILFSGFLLDQNARPNRHKLKFVEMTGQNFDMSFKKTSTPNLLFQTVMLTMSKTHRFDANNVRNLLQDQGFRLKEREPEELYQIKRKDGYSFNVKLDEPHEMIIFKIARFKV